MWIDFTAHDPKTESLFISPAKTHNYRLRVTIWSFWDGAPGKLCQIKESVSSERAWWNIPTWVFGIHDKTTSGVFIVVCFSTGRNINSAVGSPGLTCVPNRSSALESLPFWSPYTPLHIWLPLLFTVSSFPLNKSHAPVPLVSRSLRCCGMSQRPPGSTEVGGSQPRFGAGCLLVPPYFFFFTEIHRCIFVLVKF